MQTLSYVDWMRSEFRIGESFGISMRALDPWKVNQPDKITYVGVLDDNFKQGLHWLKLLLFDYC